MLTAGWCSTGFEETKDYPIEINGVIAGRYQILEFLGAAAFSKAVQCVDLTDGSYVCIKIIKNNKVHPLLNSQRFDGLGLGLQCTGSGRVRGWSQRLEWRRGFVHVGILPFL